MSLRDQQRLQISMTNSTHASGGAITNGVVCEYSESGLPRTATGFSYEVDMALKSLYIVIIIAAISLNVVILYAFTKKSMKLTSLNILLLNLVTADLFTAVGVCPYIAVHPESLGQYSPSTADFFCSITFGQTLFWIGNSASVSTLCIISINRYLLINHPTKPLVFMVKKRRVSVSGATFVWSLAFLLVVPNFFSRRYDYCMKTCPREWPEGFHANIYAIVTTILGYVIPVLCLFYTFIATVRTMWFKKRPVGSDTALRRSRKRVVTLLGTLIFVFSFCWTPFVIYWIISRATNIFPTGWDGYYARTKANHVTILISLCNSVINPIVYGLKSRGIKNALRNRKRQSSGEL